MSARSVATESRSGGNVPAATATATARTSRVAMTPPSMSFTQSLQRLQMSQMSQMPRCSKSAVRFALAGAVAVAMVALAARPGAPLLAQQAVPKLPPVRALGPVLARSDEPMSAISTAVPLPGGKVLINDVLQRRVVLLDSTLKLVAVVADSTAATGNAYGQRGGGLIGYHGDSALFIDPASLSMMVIDPAGILTTVRAVPRANEIGLLAGGPNGRPGFDPQGRLVYRGQARARQAGAGAGARGGRDGAGGGNRGAANRGGGNAGVGGPGGMTFQMPEQPDSAPVWRVDLATRALDTLARIKIPKVDIKMSQGADGRMNIQTTVNPMPSVDDWALLSDGTLAIVRGHDFHVDWRAPDGTVTSGPKLAFEWQRLSDDDKQFIIDSSRTAIEKQRAEAQRMMAAAGGPQAFIQGGGGERAMVMLGGGGGGAPPQRAAAAPAPTAGAAPGAAPGAASGAASGAAAGPGGFQIPPINLVPANELPDYRPPFNQMSALGDLDGLLWIRTSAATGTEGPIYYVINRQNEVVDRIQIPQGRLIAGFGKGGIVYLGFRDTEGKGRVEIARWK